MSDTPVQATKKAPASIALFTRRSDKKQAMLFVAKNRASEKSPVFYGTFAGNRVSAFVKQAEGRKPFLSFVTPDDVQVATGNVMVLDSGIPKLKTILADKSELWISISQNVSDAMLIDLGANPERLHVRTAKAVKQAVPA